MWVCDKPVDSGYMRFNDNLTDWALHRNCRCPGLSPVQAFHSLLLNIINITAKIINIKNEKPSHFVISPSGACYASLDVKASSLESSHLVSTVDTRARIGRGGI